MKGLAILVFFAFCGLVYCKPGETYSSQYDSIDIDKLLENDRLVKNLVDCLLGGPKCTKEGEAIKKNLDDALQNKCSKCTEFQKVASRKVIRYLIKEKRAWFNDLQKKYDPDNTYVKTYADELKQEGITL